ncbi:response regulator receiver modulated CheW protein [Desulfovibrio sp. X2]|uniref:chemotaxis protein n=1 Tax=Desulfovibrio sp. X2 TaxID=941449 RepID=UPI0003587998|nr:chemotaxis protein [Desulfovibrio sp. X2]EPR43114.1 response regulator receiver modulated CheW protein [Desulfovibrio sp. X2]
MANTNILLEAGTNELEIVEFYIDELGANGETYRGYYGVNVAKVLEIIRLPQITSLPGALHPSVRGTFNLRNKVISLVHLPMWLGKSTAPSPEDKVIVTEFNNVVNAFQVSGVTRIHRLSWGDIEPPSVHVQRFSEESVTGVVRLDTRVVFLLDMEKIVGELNPNLGLRPLDSVCAPGEEFCYRALIADDSTTIRRMIGSSLEQAGFQVTRTINGEMAWNKLQEWKGAAESAGRPMSEHVHVIISDIEMPGMDGHSLTRRIKSDPSLKEIPVILFSSLITDKLRHKGDAVGADDQISKPEMSSVAVRAKALADRYLGRTEA